MNHEELIWNYLDGLCNTKEREKVNSLIKTDKEFNDIFDSLSRLDRVMTSKINQSVDPAFRAKLLKSLTESLVRQEAVKPLTWILSPAWTMVLTIAGAAAVIFAYLLFGMKEGDFAGKLPFFSPELVRMVTLICVSFVFLSLMDVIVKRYMVKHKGVTTLLV